MDELIEYHHALLHVRGGAAPELVEAFRRADLVDVSAGLLGWGLDRGFLREVVAAHPYRGFHGVLVRRALSWAFAHPLRPLPMLRWRGPAASAAPSAEGMRGGGARK